MKTVTFADDVADTSSEDSDVTDDEKITLTPNIPFPTTETLCSTASDYGLSRHVGHQTFISSVNSLAKEKLR